MTTRGGARAAVATLLVGALFGYVVSALATPLIQNSGLVGNGELPEARAYMIALLQANPDSIVALTPGSGVVARAQQFANANAAAGNDTPVSLTYIGGRSVGGMTVNVYAIEVRSATNGTQVFPLALTLVGGKVVRSE